MIPVCWMSSSVSTPDPRLSPVGGASVARFLRTALDAPFLPRGRVIPLLFMACAVASCARIPAEAGFKPPSWEARQDGLIRLRSWALKARVAVRNGGEAATASLFWAQREDEYQLRATAPLGGGAYLLEGREGVALLRGPGQETERAGDAETLLLRRLGWRLPVSHLAYWVRGLPSPALPVSHLALDEENRLEALEQGGWVLLCQDYVSVEGNQLPRRLTLRSKGGSHSARLSIRRWDLR